MKKFAVLILIGLGLVFTTNIHGQVIDKKNLASKIDALIPAAVKEDTPGVVVGIVDNGELIFSKGYGIANIAYDIPNNPNLVFNIGSVSKQFLGYAFAMLHVKGLLNIDDPVNKYLEDWPEFKHPVTIRHLLTHTSGYREAYAMSTLAGRPVSVDRLSRAECLNVVRNQPELEFEPGTRYTYNSTAWVILAEILEKVIDQPADEWVEKNILSPLEMKDTQIESYVGEVIKNSAESYSFDKQKGYINEESNRAIFGAAEIYSNIPDLTKWINHYRTASVGGKKVMELFLDPYILSDGTNSTYALGIGNSTYRGLRRYMHTGSHEAFQTQLAYFPEQDMGIITISNFGGKGRLAAMKIADLLLEEHMTPQLDQKIQSSKLKKEDLEQLEGVYLAATLNRTVHLKMVDGFLEFQGDQLIPVSANTFKIEGWGGKIKIEKQKNGNTQLTSILGTERIYNKVEKWTPTTKELSSFEGDYWSEELETIYHLSAKKNKLLLTHRWLGEIPLEPITKDFFKSEDGFYVQFVRDNKEEISGLSVYSGRTLNVYFQRQ